MWSLAAVLASSLCCLASPRGAFLGFATSIDSTRCVVPIVKVQPCRRPLR
ncbi:hypothetical protein [Metapseudomonas lalkuanensis]|nr:hypothetical protein [Pseudomonas lalkuanensis]